MKVSIIIPAYNVEKYIVRALDSAYGQTMSEKEIIVVVDGATDGTLEKVKKYCATHSGITYYYTENGGLSHARNYGFERASGDYVCFLDSDDYFADNDVIENFYIKCEKYKLDVIRGAYKIFSEDKNDFIPHYKPSFPKLNQPLDGKDFFNYSMDYHFNEVVAWLGLYKRDFLIKHSFVFPNGLLYEDQFYFLRLCLTENVRIMQTDEYFYVYVKRGGTITTSFKFKHATDIAIATNDEYDYIKNLKIDKKTKKSAIKYISATFYQLTTVYGSLNKQERKKCVKLVKLSIRNKLMFSPYNKHIGKKIFLFNYLRFILDRVYDRRKNA